MKKLYRTIFAALVIASLLTLVSYTAVATAHQNDENSRNHFRARLSGLQQVPTLFSTGSGVFTATIIDGGTTVSYTLTYSGLTGAMAAHIHLGERATNGGVIAFLCGGGGKPACPTSSGTVTGTITATDVIGPTSQGLSAGAFTNFLTALRSGATYVNVHTPAFPSGEIRGQIIPSG
ncbi:MAG TPA: CHRD domain-containing protein [Nitrososphaerales archaeon]|nr:CHRD domain-containing protein [Nitrososphaerales archaeon]